MDVELEHRHGDRGVLVAHGDQGGGYVLYVDDDADAELVFAHNGYGPTTELGGGPVPEGIRRIRLSVTAPGQWSWDVAISVDGEPRASCEGLVMLGAMAPFEGINVGIDRRSPVSWALHERHGTFAYTGDLHAVTYTPGEPAPDAGNPIRRAPTRGRHAL